MLKPLLILSFMQGAGAACAADPVTDLMQRTYGPYRVALFRTNSNAQEESRLAVAQA